MLYPSFSPVRQRVPEAASTRAEIVRAARVPPRSARPARAHSVRLRAAEIDDIPEILAIETRCFRSDRSTARSLRSLIRAGRAFLLVATGDEQILGYICVQFRSNSDCARVTALAIRREARGRGLGRVMMRAAERRARHRGCDRVRLEVRVSNRRALALYRMLGYVPLRALPDYYADGGDALRMEKQLRRTTCR